ncbi:alpha/beta hydrolase [Biostraticola tofi]|uniref:Haloacetate dehalogenase n=1 Tax=Biostraticola tofi TaxID=466109 RepID=A0A4R3YS24_9GAMM|nr:alpha/beta hydrolase [Biostraticola tofi]TCV95270.1 haloacetate dehalogenase [Biostraticola tofi]
MFEDFTAHRINTGSLNIACVTSGTGEPVLLLHGFPQTMAIWARIAPALVARGYCVVCADLRGYGASDKPPAETGLMNYGFRAMARDQVMLMQALGHSHFHVIGHDRGARTAHRMALDYPDTVKSVTLMDIVPTVVMLKDLRHEVAKNYWHWFFLSQPAPFPERVIQTDADFFFENCLFGWGAAGPEDFDPIQLEAYRAAWRDPETISGFCNDYRATLTVDLVDDLADEGRLIEAPVLVLYGDSGVMARLYDLPATWNARCSRLTSSPISGGHFFPDSQPDEVIEHVTRFLLNYPFA